MREPPREDLQPLKGQMLHAGDDVEMSGADRSLVGTLRNQVELLSIERENRKHIKRRICDLNLGIKILELSTQEINTNYLHLKISLRNRDFIIYSHVERIQKFL